MSKQTAVEWYRNTFFKALQEGLITSESEIFEQAKAMEREQIEDAYEDGVGDENERNLSGQFTNAKQYYTKTYGGDK